MVKKEIQDIIDSIDFVVKNSKGKIDKKRVGILGGSHGGFLTCKAIAKHPEKFKAAVAFNPVTNLPVLVGVSDIPDWPFVESGLPLRNDFCPNPEEIAAMLSYSPISHVKSVKTPTLFLLGEKDARVPYLHNNSFINSLKAQGVDCKVHLYKDGGHSLIKTTEMKFDSDINSALWLCKYLLQAEDSE